MVIQEVYLIIYSVEYIKNKLGLCQAEGKLKLSCFGTFWFDVFDVFGFVVFVSYLWLVRFDTFGLVHLLRFGRFEVVFI